LHILILIGQLHSAAGVIFGAKSPNKQFKSDSARMAFLLCVGFGD